MCNFYFFTLLLIIYHLPPNKPFYIKMPRGPLIVFEGTDRSGKTTLCQNIAEEIQEIGFMTPVFDFPDRRTRIGRILDKYLKNDLELDDCVAHHLFSANKWELSEQIELTLTSGAPVLADRYVASGTAYSVAKGNLTLDWCQQFNTNLPKPDLTIFLEGNIENLQTRPNYGSERFENIEFQTRVRAVFEQIRAQESNWTTILVDGKTSKQIQKEIRPILMKLLDNFLSFEHPILRY